MCTQKAVEGVVKENEPVPVLWAQYWSGATCGDGSSGGWSVASANTWYAELIRAAGGSLIVPVVEAACESWGAPYLSTAQLLEVGKDAAVMISPGPWAEDQDVSSLKAWICVKIKFRAPYAIDASCFPLLVARWPGSKVT